MAGETMQHMPMSPRQSPTEIGSAAVQWACGRRGRTMVMAIVLFTILLGLGGLHNREVSYKDLELVAPGSLHESAANQYPSKSWSRMLTETPGHIVTISNSLVNVPLGTLHSAHTLHHPNTFRDPLEHDAPARKWRTRASPTTTQEDVAKLPPRHARSEGHACVL